MRASYIGLLCCNAAFLSILLAGYTSGVLGLVLSTVLIVIFAEIIPQARFSRFSALPHVLPTAIFCSASCLARCAAGRIKVMLGAAGILFPPWACVWSLHGVADPRVHANSLASGMAAVVCP